MGSVLFDSVMMATSYNIFFPSHGFSKRIEKGKTLLEAARENGLPVRSDCGGEGFCGKCLVQAEPQNGLTPLTETELERLSPLQIKQGFRLACQAGIKADLTVHILLTGTDSQEVRGKEALAGSFPVDQTVKRWFFTGTDGADTPGDILERVEKGLQDIEKPIIRISEYQALNELSVARPEKNLTLVLHEERGLISVLEGVCKRSLGLAVDLGTTTLAAYLCDLKSGQVLATASSMNPQRRYGEDVISRIGFCHENPKGLKILHDLIIETLNDLVWQCLEKIGAEKKDIDALTVVGNTTMGHIFAGLNPSSLGRSPYLPLMRKMPSIKAADLGLDLNPGTDVYLFPVLSGFVGGDTLGVVLADNLHQRDEVTLIVDIGTNGEVVLGNKKGLVATSCATGPALEGAHLSCGMRAVSGAIHRVSIDPSTYKPFFEVLGEGNPPPLGICGSGVIDAVAAMRQAGLILENGRLKEGLPGVTCDERGIGRQYRIVPKERSATGEEIGITLLDIRQIQLAKSALAAGIELLMRKMGVSHLDRTVLTGAFGACFNWRSAVIIGMLPLEIREGEIICRDNLAGMGAVAALLDKKKKKDVERLIHRIGHRELADEPDFAERFTRLTRFPDLAHFQDIYRNRADDGD